MQRITLNHIRFALVTLQDVVATTLHLVERAAERWEVQSSGLYGIVASAQEAQELFNRATETVNKDAIHQVHEVRNNAVLQEKEDEYPAIMSMAEMEKGYAAANLPLPMTLQSAGVPS